MEQVKSLKVCHDEIIAVVQVSNSQINIRRPKAYQTQFVGLDTYVAHQHRYRAPILIVTESPHIEEFKVYGVSDFSSGQPVYARPVNGLTGQNIVGQLVGLLNGSSILAEDGNYPVIVVNALQEQCSEGRNTLDLRTRHFIGLWAQRRDYLAERLNMLNPCVVLCSCTVGDFRLADGSAAYSAGSREVFEGHFIQLLNEFNLTESTALTPYRFLGSKDLAGLVLNVIDEVYGQRQTPIFKTTHPASWQKRPPRLNSYSRTRRYQFG